MKRVSKEAVIQDQKEVIEAQNTLIEWLLRKVERRKQRKEKRTEVRNGRD